MHLFGTRRKLILWLQREAVSPLLTARIRAVPEEFRDSRLRDAQHIAAMEHAVFVHLCASTSAFVQFPVVRIGLSIHRNDNGDSNKLVSNRVFDIAIRWI